MKKAIASIAVLFLISCGKQTAPNLIVEDKEATVANNGDTRRIDLPRNNDVNIPEKSTETPETARPQFSTSNLTPDKTEPVSISSGHAPAIDRETSVDGEQIPTLAPLAKKEEIKLVTERPEKAVQVEPAEFPDFDWEKYMILPGDFLIKIANKEYGDFRMWRKIYEWNRDQIGDNPNIIYPYQFLNMMKERQLVKKANPVYFTYNVQHGDNLWNIAGKQYGDPKSWIILLWDNEETIKNSNGVLTPGMSLLLREKLDPKA